jgi:hypothetical protein
MRELTVFCVFSALCTFCQAPTPSLAGVWKADLQKSKIPGPPITEYLSLFEEKTVVVNRRTQEQGLEINEASGTWGGPRGEERTAFSFVVNGKPVVRPYEGVPTQMIASWQGDTLTLTALTAGQPTPMTRTYELSSDEQSLTITTHRTWMGKEIQSVVVLNKQPDSAGQPLRQPEALAQAHFKNVKTQLKTLPVSEFINQMRYFAWSLGKDCQFCHVQNHFDSDDKKDKKTARQMIEMAAHINADNFENKPQVRCFTCHEGNDQPPSYPAFPHNIGAQLTSGEVGAGASGGGGNPAQRTPK